MSRDAFAVEAGRLPEGDGPAVFCLRRPPAVTRTALIVPPPFEERKAARAALAAAAAALARTGCAALTLDPAGTGDAPGDDAAFTVETWARDLHAAAAWLRRRFPAAPQVWLGLRAGAALALREAAADAAPPAALVLWEPVEGPACVRQLLQRRLVNDMLAHGRARVARADIERQLAAGGTVDLDGFPLTAALHAGLQSLGAAAWPGPGLVVATGPDTRPAEACCRLAPGLERLDLRLPPFWNTVGLVDTAPLAAATADWIGRRVQGREGNRPDQSDPTDPTDLLPAERFVSFPGAGGVLRGVLHAPPPGTPVRGRLLFLPGWSGDRTGPHRMFVRAARRLAARGWTCLRLDYGGRGDSDGAPAVATIGSMTTDAQAALAWLRAAAPDGGTLAIAAICSGCKVALSVAADEPDVARLALWSAESMGSLRAGATGRRKTRDALRAYGRKLLQRETWRKLLRGQVRARMVGRALVQPEVRSAAEARAEDATLGRLRSYRGSILFVYGGSDPDAAGSSAAYDGFCTRHNIAHIRHTVPHAGHSYYGLEWEAEVLRTTEKWLG
jgi:alpha/beta superfamily hydrolase